MTPFGNTYHQRYFARSAFTCYDENVNVTVLGELVSYPMTDQVTCVHDSHILVHKNVGTDVYLLTLLTTLHSITCNTHVHNTHTHAHTHTHQLSNTAKFSLPAGLRTEFKLRVTNFPDSFTSNRPDQVITIAGITGTGHQPCYDFNWAYANVYRQFLCSTGFFGEPGKPAPDIYSIENSMEESVQAYKDRLRSFQRTYSSSYTSNYYALNTCEYRYIDDFNYTRGSEAVACGSEYTPADDIRSFRTTCEGIAINPNLDMFRRYIKRLVVYGPSQTWDITLPLSRDYGGYEDYKYSLASGACCCKTTCNCPVIWTYYAEQCRSCACSATMSDIVRTCSNSSDPAHYTARYAELQQKYLALKSWVENRSRRDCVERIQSCNGKRSCDFVG